LPGRRVFASPARIGKPARYIAMIKVLLLGLGRWGANHLRILHSLPVEFYVADVQAKSLESARKLGIPETHCSAEPLAFLPRVDAAVIVTPAQTHFDLARQFMEAGKDVFVEKPITLASPQAKELARLAEERQRILQVGHIFRFDPASQWLREAIQEGQFGHVRLLRGNFSGFKRPRNDSGVAFADAIHFVDLFNYLLGQTPASVAAVTKDFLGRGMEDASWLSLEYATPAGIAWATVETNSGKSWWWARS
jgi:UDP-N-acetylglucosamine 3-dehydrogenase